MIDVIAIHERESMLPHDWDIPETRSESLPNKPKVVWNLVPDAASASLYALIAAACFAAWAWVPDLANQIEWEHRAEVNHRLRQQIDSWLIVNEGRRISESEHGVPPIPARKRSHRFDRPT
jgi:hypothetical protein